MAGSRQGSEEGVDAVGEAERGLAAVDEPVPEGALARAAHDEQGLLGAEYAGLAVVSAGQHRLDLPRCIDLVVSAGVLDRHDEEGGEAEAGGVGQASGVGAAVLLDDDQVGNELLVGLDDG
jgi:hypothetical protein